VLVREHNTALARRGIRQLLASHADVDVVGEARHDRETVKLVNALQPDLIFLDVQMPELDGFGVLRELEPAGMPVVIFVTAYDTFAVRAFAQHALLAERLSRLLTGTTFGDPPVPGSRRY
jgi:two-component system LytT family response regulator